MKCPFCGYSESKVIDSRPAEEGATIRRRRECLACQKRFTTYEKVETIPLIIIKKDNKKIGYISLSLFSSNSYEQFKNKLEKLEDDNIDSLIIDVRDIYILCILIKSNAGITTIVR